MQKIRYKKMLCLGTIGSNGENQLLTPVIGFNELIGFLHHVFQKHRNCAVFLNRQGKPIFIETASLSAAEKQYFGLSS